MGQTDEQAIVAVAPKDLPPPHENVDLWDFRMGTLPSNFFERRVANYDWRQRRREKDQNSK